MTMNTSLKGKGGSNKKLKKIQVVFPLLRVLHALLTDINLLKRITSHVNTTANAVGPPDASLAKVSGWASFRSISPGNMVNIELPNVAMTKSCLPSSSFVLLPPL